jgi:hypothetical protein
LYTENRKSTGSDFGNRRFWVTKLILSLDQIAFDETIDAQIYLTHWFLSSTINLS